MDLAGSGGEGAPAASMKREREEGRSGGAARVGEEWRCCSERGGAPALSRRGRGAVLKGEIEGGVAV